MSVIPFDENILLLPSCSSVHGQLRSILTKLTFEEYAKFIQQLSQSHICGIIRKTGLETTVLGLAVYHYHLTTFDTVRFEIDDLIVDEKERNHGLGTRILDYLIDQAKQLNAFQILVHCDLTNTGAHRFLFRLGSTISIFEFYLKNSPVLPNNDQIQVVDITDLPEDENEKLLTRAQDVFRQLRPHLSTDQKVYIKQIRDICRTGPARMLVAISNEDILGLAVYRVSNNIKYLTHIYCDDLVTNDNSRSSGVGRCLINYMKIEGEKLGLDQLTLDSGCQRGRAHKFYHREGFNINHFGFTIPF
jgi:GNAT superfamily N-acetyltransferase